jgi:hypothetical protein
LALAQAISVIAARAADDQARNRVDRFVVFTSNLVPKIDRCPRRERRMFHRARVRHPMVRNKPMDVQIYHQFAKRLLANHPSELTKRDAACFIRTSLSQFEKRLDELKEHDNINTRSSQR